MSCMETEDEEETIEFFIREEIEEVNDKTSSE